MLFEIENQAFVLADNVVYIPVPGINIIKKNEFYFQWYMEMKQE